MDGRKTMGGVPHARGDEPTAGSFISLLHSCPPRMWGRTQNGKREPRAAMIIRLGRALGIAPGELLDETDRLMRECNS